MRKILLISFFLMSIVPIGLASYQKDRLEKFLEEIGNNNSLNDTIVDYSGYNIHIINDIDSFSHVGLNLFSEEIKIFYGKKVLDFIEGELLKMCFKVESQEHPIKIITGNVNSFKDINPNTPCSITISNSKELSVAWDTDEDTVKIALSVNYQTIQQKSRKEIEELFIAKLKEIHKKGTHQAILFDMKKAVPYGENFYVIPGPFYQNKDINRNIFSKSENEFDPIWDISYPLESIANMFIFPHEKYSDIKVTLKVLKHEFGEQEIFTIELEQFLAYCEEEGCIPFWGVEKFQNGKIEGALFLYNQLLGYDHIIKIDCIPEDIIQGDGVVLARASLYVPNNNVSNLFQPYVNKNEK